MSTDSLAVQVAQTLQVQPQVVTQILSLLNSGATVPFIARYRKEVTQGADEVLIQNVKDAYASAQKLAERRAYVLSQIKEAGKLTDKLREALTQATSLSAIEDIYLPFKATRKSKGQKAIDAGLKPLAIFMQKNYADDRIEAHAENFICDGYDTITATLAGAMNILAEWNAAHTYVIQNMRKQFEKFAVIESKAKRGKKEEGVAYKNYFDFSEPVKYSKSHRALAIFRGEKQGFLNVKITVDQERAFQNIQRSLGRGFVSNTYTDKAVEEAYTRVLQPYFESEIKKQLRTQADSESIEVFGDNLRQLLLQSPLGKKAVLAIDPGFRTGCKAVVLNNTGNYVQYTTLFPHPPKVQIGQAQKWVLDVIAKHHVEAVAIGNGTAGNETRDWIKSFLPSEVDVFMVNEDGASIYSASELARAEFGELDITVRGAISIGRRLMDPLAELVKIDAKSIGVGQYQHDVNQPLLRKKLDEVVESCVNHVGVELNLASTQLLTYVSGLGPSIAQNIVAFREANGPFTSRTQLKKVAKLGAKSFEQCAGFLRIENAKNVLDSTIIHPEMYGVVDKIAQKEGKTVAELFSQKCVSQSTIEIINQEYGAKQMALVWSQIKGNDPQDPRPTIQQQKRNTIKGIEEVYAGQILHGTVSNITNFGAFIDLGIKHKGLIHISEVANRFVDDIHSVLKLNQEVRVKVLQVDTAQNKIQLTLRF